MYSKETKFLGLPQWGPKDHPDFITDMNDVMKKLDTQAEKTDHDHSDLREQVDALSIDMGTVKEQVAALQEKVDNLVDLEDNPVFIALKEHVDTLQETVDGIIQTDNRQDLDIQQLQAAITRIDETIGIIENHLQQHDSHFDIHDKELSDIKATILHIENDVDDLRSHVTHMEESVAQMETEVGHMKGEQITQNDRLDALEAGKTEQDEKISGIETKITEQDTKISTIEQTAKDADETAEAALEEAMKAVSTANGTSAETEVLTQGLADMKDRVDGIDERVTNNTTSIGNLNQMYETLDDRMDTLEQSDTKQNADILKAETKADTALSTAEGISTTVTTVEGRVTVLETDNAANKTNIQNLYSADSALNTRLTTAEEDIQELKDRPSGGDVTTEQFNELADRVTTTEAKNTEQDTSISAIETTVEELEAQVVTASTLQEMLVTDSTNNGSTGAVTINLTDTNFDLLVLEFNIVNVRYTTNLIVGKGREYIAADAHATGGVQDGYIERTVKLSEDGSTLVMSACKYGPEINNNLMTLTRIFALKKASSTALSEAVVTRVDALESEVSEINTELTEIQNKLVTPQFRDDLMSSTRADINYSWIHLPEYKIGILVIKNVKIRESMLRGASFEEELPGFTIHPISGEIPVVFDHVHYSSTTSVNVFKFTLTQLSSGSIKIKIELSTTSPATTTGITTIQLGRTFVFHY